MAGSVGAAVTTGRVTRTARALEATAKATTLRNLVAWDARSAVTRTARTTVGGWAVSRALLVAGTAVAGSLIGLALGGSAIARASDTVAAAGSAVATEGSASTEAAV